MDKLKKIDIGNRMWKTFIVTTYTFCAYIILMAVIWAFTSIDILVKNKSLERLGERKPYMKNLGMTAPHKYIPLFDFLWWPVDMIKEMNKQNKQNKIK